MPDTRVLAEVIAPGAATVDSEGVPRAHLDALARAGLLGKALQPAAAQRELAELLAGCDASTWFCWTQHQSPLVTLTQSIVSDLTPNVDEIKAQYVQGMSDGSIVNAVAFAHVRRPGPPNPVARRVSGGWVFAGTLDWVTTWDIADVVMVMAQGEGEFADRFVCALLPAGRSGMPMPCLTVGEPLRLLAMSGTHTRPALLDNCFVSDENIIAILDRDDWLAFDAQRTADPNPSAFGLTRGALSELATIAEVRRSAALAELAQELADECRRIRSRSYQVIDLPDRDATRSERLDLRARSLELAVRAANAVVVARAGGAMLSGTSAERRAREALFLYVQAQTADTRMASLELLRPTRRK